MKLLIAVLFVAASVANAEYSQVVPDVTNTAYGYLTRYGIPEAERIRKAEEAYLSQQRIVGGSPAALGEYPYQAGLLISIIGITGTGVCGGSLISSDRVITAAHCWSDGQNQAWRFTVVLGSVTLFSGGERMDTSVVVTHNNWFPQLVRNDVAVVYLPNAVSLSSSIAPIALPTEADVDDDFAGYSALASGFGITSDGAGISVNQVLSHVRLSIIANSVCRFAFPLILADSHICTSGVGGVGTCSGDSGGPLIVNKGGRDILVGITSFGSALGCESALPAAFSRVTSFLTFINQHI